MNGSNRERDDDSFVAVALLQGLDEFVLDQIVVDKTFRPQNYCDVDARLVERMVTDERFELAHAAGDAL
jgi:hypothetical protein